MDPILALVAEWWWIAPAGAGAGTLGWIGLRRRGPNQRRLELDAARLDVRTAAEEVTRSRAQVKVARAELLRAQAEKSASRAPAGAVAEARRRVQQAERHARAAVADLRARRAGVNAARATMPGSRAAVERLPLARLMAEHDALTARWMEYETDPLKAIGFPAMTDARWPPMDLFLREHQQASWLRPPSRDARISAADYSAYRDAVRRATHAFDAAERSARSEARGGVPGGARPEAIEADRADWGEVAQDLLDNAQRAIARSTELWNRMRRDRDDRGGETPRK
ncbi:efflux RND transporter periplasmic adaptor subunit [Microbacterium radiodurans]|uniref:Uncharacterized protein n=1 Tax=Microbacterium radiodurans TaxID=661398 RepID=A0A5J5IU19_9MICO|nr:hypothetical protein [Microbacterium radiodurans]KAA9089337.1 hypothetical protein F6B42_02305 [Microbacterium radiodurans]